MMNREELFRRIKAARVWLEKAEHSYGTQSAWQGELNLMLALAEIQKLKERRKKSPNGYMHQVTVLLLALTMVAGVGWYWWDNQWKPSASPFIKPVPVTATPSATVIPASIPVVVETHKEVSEVHHERGEKPAPAVMLSRTEIQAVVRDAGKALRGQE